MSVDKNLNHARDSTTRNVAPDELHARSSVGPTIPVSGASSPNPPVTAGGQNMRVVAEPRAWSTHWVNHRFNQGERPSCGPNDFDLKSRRPPRRHLTTPQSQKWGYDVRAGIIEALLTQVPCGLTAPLRDPIRNNRPRIGHPDPAFRSITATNVALVAKLATRATIRDTEGSASKTSSQARGDRVIR